MKRFTLLTLLAIGCAAPARPPATPAPAAVTGPVRPVFDPASGELQPPYDYRSWVYLTSGYQMSYGPAAVAANEGGVGAYDTVFVDPAGYAGFMKTGTWPEHTMFVLEIRAAEKTGSIVTGGRYQTDLLAIEAEIKDARIPGGWGFFSFPPDASGPTGPTKRIPSTEACYSCHATNAGVENTFTQFYPTLFAVAQARGTVRPDFVGIPPSVSQVHARIAQAGFAAGREMIDAAVAKWPEATIAREVSLNRLGYALVREQKIDAAIELFTDVARRFPTSPNAWDSLAETCEGAGKLEEARAANDKGLAVIDQLPAGPRREALEKALQGRAARLAR
jgi:hypothetical protein